jgi:NADH:ubiquinone oxidoreductase subunit 6 (subunit J)
MDSLHATGFYVSSGVLLIGALAVALLPGREQRGAGLLAVGLGLAGACYSLSAGFAGAVAFVCYAGCAVMVAGPRYRSIAGTAGVAWRQAGALGAALVLAVLVYSSWRGNFVSAPFKGGPFNAVALGRLLFAHDVVATEAIALFGLLAIVGAAAGWRFRERTR